MKRSGIDNYVEIIIIKFTLSILELLIKKHNPNLVLQLLYKLPLSKIVFNFYVCRSAERMRKSNDILLSIGLSDYSQIPSKLVEYIANGKLIIHFLIDGNDPAIKLLTKYQNKIIVNMSREVEIDRLEKRILSMYKIKNSYGYISHVYKYASPDYIVNQLKNWAVQNNLCRYFKE